MATTVNMPTSDPSRKVTAASLAAAVAGFVLWLLGTYVFKGDVPEPVQVLVLIVVPAVASFVAGYFTKRSAREASAPPAN